MTRRPLDFPGAAPGEGQAPRSRHLVVSGLEHPSVMASAKRLVEEGHELHQPVGSLVPPHAAAVVGVGGVGSWAAEALARSGVRALTLIDLDHVAESNINRQVQALGATLGAIFIGEVMGQTPCLLCWWQRVFMFPLAIVLGVGVLKPDSGTFRYGLPLSLLGAGVAAYHSLTPEHNQRYQGLLMKVLYPDVAASKRDATAAQSASARNQALAKPPANTMAASRPDGHADAGARWVAERH